MLTVSDWEWLEAIEQCEICLWGSVFDSETAGKGLEWRFEQFRVDGGVDFLSISKGEQSEGMSVCGL